MFVSVSIMDNLKLHIMLMLTKTVCLPPPSLSASERVYVEEHIDKQDDMTMSRHVKWLGSLCHLTTNAKVPL